MPELHVHEGRVTLTWLEPVGTGDGEGHRLRLANLGPKGWSEPVTIAEDRPFFANWADRPGITTRGDGGLIAHWLEKTSPDAYAYKIELAGSGDGGATWHSLGTLNDDGTDSEHGFVSWIPEGAGARAFWLDGRATVEGAPMTLRTALVDKSPAPSESLDDSVCDCCSTSATTLGGEPVVVYRDRSAEEIRDIAILRRSVGRWGEPDLVNADGWRIEGCPVNGPAVTAVGRDLAVAWFSASDDTPKVQLGFAAAAETFSSPILLDGGAPIGRIDMVEDGRGGVLVSWLARGEEGARIQLARVSREGAVSPISVLGVASPSRSSGVPRMATSEGYLYVAWVGASEDAPSKLRVRRVPVEEVADHGVGT